MWYSVLNEENQGYVSAAVFKPVIHLIPERSASAVLAQTVVKKWWDTTHTFHIAGQKMTITPYDFHRMTGLWFNGVLISLENESGVWLGADLLGRRYATETIRYTDLKVNFMHCPQGTAKKWLQMARAFLLFLVGTYLFTTGGQMVFLRWLALFRDF